MPELPDFATLEKLKEYLASVRKTHVSTMSYYRSDDGCGFYHEPTDRKEASLSSSATCIASLVYAGEWNKRNPWWGRTSAVGENLLKRPWRSAGLDENNPFSVSFIAEGILDLRRAYPDYKDDHWPDHRNAAAHLDLIKGEATPILKKELEKGYVHIGRYPPSAYLTQLAFRVLHRLDPDQANEVRDVVHNWASSEINKQIALISAKSRLGDPLSLAYALILARTTIGEEETKPEEKEIFSYSLQLFFETQKPDGSWPPSQPLFHYPKVGNAHCYEYELLTQLLSCQALRDDLLPYIPKLAASAFLLEKTRFELDGDNPGASIAWASGHHPQLKGAESWSTAAVYQFAHVLDRLVAEAIRRVVFQELRLPYSGLAPSKDPENPAHVFAQGLLDAKLTLFNGSVVSLRKTIAEQLVHPVARETKIVEDGGQMNDSTAMSAILFGPPGVSKTQLAKYISNYIGWPLLSVDPSYLVQDGLDKIQARANRFFNMITATECAVVLLDEFDEMGRDRSKSEELLSRFITTAMLPKLVSINQQRKIVFLLATNFVSGFDAAFSRGGRFDLLIQVMPPKTEEKLTHWPELRAAYDKLDDAQRHEVYPWLENLTYAECKQLVSKIVGGQGAPVEIVHLVKAANESSTLSQKNEKKTWKETSEEERQRIRLMS